ncbi:nucleotidyl transferase AbiEii/AbiGii toxin family protein [Nocardia sp. MW-W600-9]
MKSNERDSVADQFGVAPEQVERDHLISYLLAAIGSRFGERLHFIGGTALARTHLTSGRLSEDIDLVALDNRAALAAEGMVRPTASLPGSCSIEHRTSATGTRSWPDRLGCRSAPRPHCRQFEMRGRVSRIFKYDFGRRRFRSAAAYRRKRHPDHP